MWLGHELDGHFGGHRQHAFAAHDDGQQVEARCVECIAAKLNGIAFNGEALHLEHVVHGEAVFQTMHATRVLGHVAADGASNLAGWIGRVVQPVLRHRFADGEVAHAALHHRSSSDGVDVEDLVELGQRQRHTHGVRHCTARQACASTACDHGHV